MAGHPWAPRHGQKKRGVEAGGLVRGIPAPSLPTAHSPGVQDTVLGVPGPSGEGTGLPRLMLRAACIHAELSLGVHRCHVEHGKEQEARAGPGSCY